MRAEKFRIEVPEADLTDLRLRLERPRLPLDFDAGDWSHGVSPGYLAGLLADWRDRYDWRRHEAAMNQYENFRVTLAGQRVHYLHVRRPHALPLLLIGIET